MVGFCLLAELHRWRDCNQWGYPVKFYKNIINIFFSFLKIVINIIFGSVINPVTQKVTTSVCLSTGWSTCHLLNTLLIYTSDFKLLIIRFKNIYIYNTAFTRFLPQVIRGSGCRTMIMLPTDLCEGKADLMLLSWVDHPNLH